MEEYLTDLRHTLKALGINKGDILYVASDITLLLNNFRKKYGVVTFKERDQFLNDFIDILKDVLGSEGTLLFPVYTWDFCRKKVFNIKTTKSEVGALNNWVLLKRTDFCRTAHPIYSFMVCGKDAPELLKMNNLDSWGEDSPFGYFYRKHAKMLLVDVHLKQCFTFMHYVEEKLQVPYRYMKNFRSLYVDKNGEKTERSYNMFVRDLDIESEPYEPDVFLFEAGVMVEEKWLDVPFRLVDLYSSYDVYKNDFLFNKGNLCYKFVNYELDWTTGQTHSDDLNN